MDAYIVLLTELLGERGAHDSAADRRWRAEVRLARLAAGGVEGCKFCQFMVDVEIFCDRQLRRIVAAVQTYSC